ncbi:NADPH:quinone reductase-like Zn-dependent oxidoreductase [Streptomyces sp. KhCrAH-43]|uniref:NADP-dependent oxidoreductase n=1 Tax=unclassified Streptomyces TaxID=2593676 RepID=UPI00037E8146|nr:MULTISPECIES: NADP-dependent oxidoreductase [unclassified Streptomyces]MYS34323.1 zinc-binding dehydrogenase [Streptomyces sp. SID4920]MYX68512.1 zinc-binding dehydrogenase [Streptomyces sp. SID8373]RAJ50754.1 NADPH:quinone reductase-like Zn-dependent oxidoreductase [Streptomyces sp. KhCrAH-43]
MHTDAIAFAGYGTPDVLEPTAIDVPDPGPGQVRIRVHATTVNPLDLKLRSGAMAAFMPLDLPYVPGLELAGNVEASGPDVRHLAPGTAVFGAASHTYAGFALADAHRLAPIPQGMDYPHAAALPVAAEAAWRALEELDVDAGQILLIHGAAGGVGTLAVQFALARGARVIGTASATGIAHLTALGTAATTYGTGLAERVRALAPSGVDKVLDTSGADVLHDSIDLTGNPDDVLTLADPMAAQAHGVRFSSGGGAGDRTADALAAVSTLHDNATLTQRIHQVLPLSQAARAHRIAEAGHLDGKIILAP